MVFKKGNKPWNAGNGGYKNAPKGTGISYYHKHREEIKTRVTRQKRERKERIAGRPKPATCEACGVTGKIVFDHDHATALFRGWICHNCNWILGLAKDNPQVLLALHNYLKRVV